MRRYDSAGDVIWSKEFAGEFAADVSTDASGGIYLTGGGPTGSFLKRFDTFGNVVWTRPSVASTAVSADGLGNVYLTGTTDAPFPSGNPLEIDATVVKFDSAGTQLWSRQFGSEITDQGLDVSADRLGNVFVSGNRSFGFSSGGDAFVTKFDAAGNEGWTRTYAGLLAGGSAAADRGMGVSADGLGNVYATGRTGGFIIEIETHSFLHKYDEAGNILWERISPIDDWEVANSVTTDAVGNVYIAGETRDTRLSERSDAFVTKYDSAGSLVWNRQFGSDSVDRGLSITADGAGSVFVTGQTDGVFATPRAGDGDVFVMKLQAVPEPSSLAISALGLAAMVLRRAQRRNSPGRALRTLS